MLGNKPYFNDILNINNNGLNTCAAICWMENAGIISKFNDYFVLELKISDFTSAFVASFLFLKKRLMFSKSDF